MSRSLPRWAVGALCCGLAGLGHAQRYSATLAHLAQTRDRPELSGPELLVSSPAAAFLVHYTTAGTDATTLAYATAIAAWADTAYSTLVGTLAWPSPPSDGTGGGDARYDIYLMGLGASTSGYTQLESYVAGGYPDDATSFVVLATGMTDDEASAAVAHHVNQACQYAYSANEMGAWMEQTAGWIEEVVFPGADQWALRTGAYLDNCHKYLYVTDGWTEHGALLWPKYLTDASGDGDLVRRIWERCAPVANNNTISATEQELAASGRPSLPEEFQAFSSWNYLCGARDDGFHYVEGDLIAGQIPVTATHAVYPCSGTNPLVTAPYGLAANYVEFLPGGSDNALRVNLSGTVSHGPWGGGIIALEGAGASREGVFQISAVTGEGDTTVTGWPTLDGIILIVQNLRLTAGSQGGYAYDAEVISSSPPSAPGGLTASVSDDWILLSWSPSSDPDGDLEGYHVYRATRSYLLPQAMMRIASAVSDQDPGSPGVQWTDQNILGANVVGDDQSNYVWVVTAVDAAANESGPSPAAGEFDYSIPYPPGPTAAIHH